MLETQVQSLVREDSLEKGMATHSSISAWRTPWTEDLAGCCPWGHKKSDMAEQLSTYTCREQIGQMVTIEHRCLGRDNNHQEKIFKTVKGSLMRYINLKLDH